MMSTNNPLQNWIDQDLRLKNLIEEITASNPDINIQAKEGFYRISEAYNVPRYPNELDKSHYTKAEEKGFDNPTCVSEEIAKIKYVYPNDDIRGITLMAIYNCLHQNQFDISECAKKKFKKVPKEYTVFYFGDDINSYLYFPKETESWIELKARSMSKIISK